MALDIVSPNHASLTVHADWGWNPPEGPGSSVRFNIFPANSEGKNPTGTFLRTKPAGYRGILVCTWLRTSEPLTGSNYIYMDLKCGQMDNDLEPAQFWGQTIKLDSGYHGSTDYKQWRKYNRVFYGFDGSVAHPMMFTFERRCDLSNPSVQVWVVKHTFEFLA